MKPLLACALLASASVAGAQQPYTVQENGKSFSRLQDAINSQWGKDATIVIQPGTYRDCAVVSAARVAFRARISGSVVLDGAVCEGKAALVLRGEEAMVDGIVFQNLRVPDGNGAGIRLEKGALTVMNATFRNSEEGILSADDAGGTIRVDRSTFSGLGRCDRGLGCAHSLYIGHYGRLYVTRSRFERGRGGHYVKSRSRFVSITDNSFDDSAGHATNYAIDLPSGATGEIARNTIVQGADKENHSAIVAIAAEEHPNTAAGLSIHDNTVTTAPGANYATAFIADYSHEALRIGANRLAPGIRPFETR